MLARTTPASASNVAVVAVDGTSDDLDEPIAALFQVCLLSFSCGTELNNGWMDVEKEGGGICLRLSPPRIHAKCSSHI